MANPCLPESLLLRDGLGRRVHPVEMCLEPLLPRPDEPRGQGARKNERNAAGAGEHDEKHDSAGQFHPRITLAEACPVACLRRRLAPTADRGHCGRNSADCENMAQMRRDWLRNGIQSASLQDAVSLQGSEVRQFRNDRLGRRAGVGRAVKGPPDDDMVGPGRDGCGGGGDALLVALVGAGGADAGGDDEAARAPRAARGSARPPAGEAMTPSPRPRRRGRRVRG